MTNLILPCILAFAFALMQEHYKHIKENEDKRIDKMGDRGANIIVFILHSFIFYVLVEYIKSLL